MAERIYSLLLVDDEEANRLLLTRRLHQGGYAVTGAENGRQALEMMRLEHFDLVLLDMYMPVMDGLATLDAIKSNPILEATTVIMLTAANTREHVVHSLSLGAVDYLVKPVNPAELMQRVRFCLENKAVRIEPSVQIDTNDLTGARVLLVDDEPLNLKLLERHLNQAKCQVSTAQSGREALEILGRKPIDAVLLDVNMPEMDGLEVLRGIRADEKLSALTVLMLSADGEEQTVLSAYQLGANDYLIKPYRLHELHLRLAVALDLRRAKMANTEKSSSNA